MNLKSPGEKVVDAVLYAVIGTVLLMVLYPFVHVLSVSFSDRGEALRYGFHFFPRSFSLEAYEQVFQARNIWVGYENTLFRMIVGTAASLLVTILAAYPLSRPYFPYKRAFTLVILFTMLFDGGIIPTYLLLRDLELINTRGVYVVLHMASAFHVLVMMSFFRTIPKELEESARIDGAGEMRTLMRIMLPLTVPVLVTLTLWNLVMHMNQFSDNLLYVTDRGKFVLQYVLQEILIQDRQDSFASLTQTQEPPAPESLKMASIMVAITPLLVIYPFLLKYFEKGTMVGSVKG